MSRFLRYLGGHGTWVLFVGVFIGLALPDLATLARPLLTPCIAVLLLLSFLRVDWRTAVDYGRRPLILSLAVVWILAVSPLLVWLALKPFNLPDSLVTALVMMASAPPILGSTALAIMLGLDAALTVCICLLATLIAPLTIPPMAFFLLDLQLEIGLSAFMLRLTLLVFGALGGALLLRWVCSAKRIEDWATEIDGLIVLLLLVFALAIMAGVTDYMLLRPDIVGLWLLAAFLANLALQALSALAFAQLGRRQALTVGLTGGNRNMVLILASLPANTEFGILLYFALAQFPMYTLPALLRGLYRRLLKSK